MANNLALVVMANIAEKHGYERQARRGGCGAAHAVAHLNGAEENLLRAAMGQSGPARPAPQLAAKAAKSPAGAAHGVLSLDELANQKR